MNQIYTDATNGLNTDNPSTVATIDTITGDDWVMGDYYTANLFIK